VSADDEWPPREARFRAALWRGEAHLERQEFFQAYRAFHEAFHTTMSVDEKELARGLAHLAAAGYKHADGDARGAARQLAHARRRLAETDTDVVDVAGLAGAVKRLVEGNVSKEFELFEVVRVRSTTETTRDGIAGLEGAVLGKSESDAGDVVAYAVALYECDGICWSLAPSALETTGRHDRREAFYDERSIRVSDEGELLEPNDPSDE